MEDTAGIGAPPDNGSEFTRKDLEEAIYIQLRALSIVAGWYIKAVADKDPAEDHEGIHFESIRDQLVDVALTDSRSLIDYEQRQGVRANEHKSCAIMHKRLGELVRQTLNKVGKIVVLEEKK